MTSSPPPFPAIVPVPWWDAEPQRLRRDQEEITGQFPELDWNPEGAGAWEGILPRWPFTRPEPPALQAWFPEGLRVRLSYFQAHPMVAPLIYPLDPEPLAVEWTQEKWHVNGDGSLCLLREDSAWTGRESVTDLLLKAAAWRVEYALVKLGGIEQMTLHGIVDDAQHDHLLAQPPAPVEVPDAEEHEQS
ncbi:hypothetical protein AB0E96_22945 [Kitasatospora sp. NPDC036755]|uniref:hypothetical protein n=1 Tax=Kitasatospora sp. NPDC036755 TaxID=3154600 RepID=UPI0033C328C5